MLLMADKPKTAWQKRLIALQRRLRFTNQEIAARLGISERLWKSWKYAERKPSVTAQKIITLLEQDKLPE